MMETIIQVMAEMLLDKLNGIGLVLVAHSQLSLFVRIGVEMDMWLPLQLAIEMIITLQLVMDVMRPEQLNQAGIAHLETVPVQVSEQIPEEMAKL